MSRSLATLTVLALTFPIAIDAPSDSAGPSGGVTRISVAGGAGTYALLARDCEGQVLSQTTMGYRDLGGEVDQQAGPLHLGIRGGVLREQVNDSPSTPGTSRYVNPYLGLEGRHAGIGGGGVFVTGPRAVSDPAPGPVSGHLRFGGRSFYLSGEVMESVPLYSGGGFADAGAGFHPARVVDCWVGVSIGPYDATGLSVKTAWQVHPRWTLDANARLGHSAHLAENGVAVGVTSRLGH